MSVLQCPRQRVNFGQRPGYLIGGFLGQSINGRTTSFHVFCGRGDDRGVGTGRELPIRERSIQSLCLRSQGRD